MFVNEVDNDQAAQAIEIALTYIKKNPNLGLSVQVISVEGNRTDSKKFLETICSRYIESVKNNQPPHVVLDTTLTSIASETVKSLTAALALPTVSMSFGQEGDIRQWRDLKEKQRDYLLQIMPPTDIIPEVVRSIVEYMNITNAAILYDESFGM